MAFHEGGPSTVVAARMDISVEVFCVRSIVVITELWQTALKNTGSEEEDERLFGK